MYDEEGRLRENNDPAARDCPKTSSVPFTRAVHFSSGEDTNKPLNRPNPQVQGESLLVPHRYRVALFLEDVRPRLGIITANIGLFDVFSCEVQR